MAENGELHLFVLWPKARFAERRILADVARETDVVFTKELRFDGDAALAYRRFYGPSLPDERRKIAHCGAGAFLLVVVRERKREYALVDVPGSVPTVCNTHMFELKRRYREWAGRRHRVHGTVTAREFARDILLLTGHAAEEWERGVPKGGIAPRLPDRWAAVSPRPGVPFSPAKIAPVHGAYPDDALLSGARVFAENRYINDRFSAGVCQGVAAVEKVSTKAVWSIGNEFRIASKMHEAAPEVTPRPLAWRFDGDGKSAAVVTERVEGPSLAEILRRGATKSEADSFAADFLALADALERTGVVHRDLFADNFLLGADGRLKAIDWQLAIDRAAYREDPWVRRNWKFRYVVFGVNREMGLGVWNDFRAMANLLAEMPQTDKVRAAAAALAARADAMTFASPPDRVTRVRLRLYGISLRLQMMLRGRRSKKYAQLERRWRTVKQKWS